VNFILDDDAIITDAYDCICPGAIENPLSHPLFVLRSGANIIYTVCERNYEIVKVNSIYVKSECQLIELARDV